MTALPFFTGINAPEIQPIDWLVKDFLARGAGTILFGQPGVSKTAHSAVMCASLCQGKDFAGMEVRGKQKVLYLDFDAGWNWSGPLFLAAFRGAGLEGLPDNFYYWSPLTEVCQLGQGENTALEFIGQMIEETVKLNNIDLVVIDSLGQAIAGDGDKAQDAALALRLGLNGSRASGASILVLDHSTKAARIAGESVPMPAGSQQKRAWARVTVALEQEGEGVNRVTRWTVDKSNSRHFAPFITKLHFINSASGQLDVLRLELMGEAGSRHSNQLDQLEIALGQVRQKLLDQGGEAKRSDFGYSGTITRALQTLVAQGEIENHRYGFYRFTLTQNELDHLTNPKGRSSGQVANELDQSNLTKLDQGRKAGQVPILNKFEGDL
jgi:hypothetical protein